MPTHANNQQLNQQTFKLLLIHSVFIFIQFSFNFFFTFSISTFIEWILRAADEKEFIQINDI